MTKFKIRITGYLEVEAETPEDAVESVEDGVYDLDAMEVVGVKAIEIDGRTYTGCIGCNDEYDPALEECPNCGQENIHVEVKNGSIHKKNEGTEC